LLKGGNGKLRGEVVAIPAFDDLAFVRERGKGAGESRRTDPTMFSDVSEGAWRRDLCQTFEDPI